LYSPSTADRALAEFSDNRARWCSGPRRMTLDVLGAAHAATIFFF
jgi:hypothetical protein